MIQRFFVITSDERLMPVSLYEVSTINKVVPARVLVEKIDFRGKNKTSVGAKFEASRIAVCERIIGFGPVDSFSGALNYSGGEFLMGHTAKIIALFLSKQNAEMCFEAEDHIVYDFRWLRQTKNVISRIDTNHPNFFVDEHLRYRLFLD